MTACVNNEKEIKGGVSHKVLRSVVAGVLAVSMVPTAAFAAEADGAEAGLLASDNVAGSGFADGTFVWNVEADADGGYAVEKGDPFILRSITDVFGTPVSISAVTVLYVADTDKDGELDAADNSSKVYTDSSKLPVGEYVALVINGAYDDAEVESGTTKYSELANLDNYDTATQAFEVVGASLSGAYAYEGANPNDTQFKVNGSDIVVGVADKAGNPIEIKHANNADGVVDILWKSKPASTAVAVNSDGKVEITAGADVAGTYSFEIKGVTGEDYEGSSSVVTFTVDPIDLSADEVTIAPVATSGTPAVLVNGEATTGVFTATALSAVDASGAPQSDLTTSSVKIITYLVSVNDAYADSKSVLESDRTFSVDVPVVTELAKFEYDGAAVTTGQSIGTFVASEGEAFKASKVEAYTSTGSKTYVDVDSVVVKKGGEVVEDWSQPGTYTVTAAVKTAKDLSYAGSVTFKFSVVSAAFSEQPKVYAQIDGKDVDALYDAGGTEYDGQPVEPTILVKDGDETLTAGEDYEVSYADADGNEVESMVEPGDYKVTVDFLGGKYYANGGKYETAKNASFDVEIAKATVRSGKADKDVYAWTGEPVSPTFTVWTKADFKGISVAVDPAVTPVTYYTSKVVSYNAAGEDVSLPATTDKNVVRTEVVADQKIAASDVRDEGVYFADVTAPADDAHVSNQQSVRVSFEVSEYAAFEDVDASAWYADPVYKARDNGYMSGIAGTKLFMPNADITREQVAAVMFNMAGQTGSAGIYFPTRFSDVDGLAWYAEPVSWAAQAGVMNGYAGTDLFGVSENATREEVACIFYNYAKAQGKDVAVEDADAVLAAMADGDTVSDWAKEAVAWAVENGVMGNAGSVWAQNPISRAEVAAMAVNFQPEALK